ncbi:MAG: CDP-glycerol glycerophosphotransferase family protein [Candidatus Cloacimonadales bacterium]|nr:CDP-glycerol glycerophosphotransferase family protein [Candidatus Cloacimonadales bacterium]
MNIYYYGNQVYQLSHCKPIFEKVGGTFIVKKITKYLPFIFSMRNSCRIGEPSSLLNAPPVKVHKNKNLEHLHGVFFSLSNVRLNVGKNSKTIFLGHGTGDKKYGGKSISIDKYDYIFLTGEKHLAKLKDVGLEIPAEKLIKIGNLRFDDYVNNKFDRRELMNMRKIKDKSRFNILYAPTWKWGNGTLLKYFFRFAKEITKEYNLIVRPHHFDARKIPFLKLWVKLNGIKNIYFSNPVKLKTGDTFQDFVLSDLMISDTSSVLYEYLITKKPIIVAQTKQEDLHNMSDSMNIMKFADTFKADQDILEVIKKNLKDAALPAKFNELLHNCFYFNDGKSTQRAVDFINSLNL